MTDFKRLKDENRRLRRRIAELEKREQTDGIRTEHGGKPDIPEQLRNLLAYNGSEQGERTDDA